MVKIDYCAQDRRIIVSKFSSECSDVSKLTAENRCQIILLV